MRKFVIIVALLVMMGIVTEGPVWAKKPTPTPLTLTMAVEGQGTVSPPEGTQEYRFNSKVTLSATPATDWTFSRWEGDLTGTANPVTIRVRSSISVTAVFEYAGPVLHTLTTAVEGSGMLDPAPGTHSYAENDVATLTAVPDTGWRFDHWEGALSGFENPAALTMSKDQSVTAVFAQLTALDDYVNAPDVSYGYGSTPVNVIAGTGYTANVWYMASQTWLTTAEVERTLWEHWLTVIVPDTVTQDTGLLFISGGKNTDAAPTTVDSDLAAVAVGTQSVVAQLRMVPNQRLRFAEELDPQYLADGRTEDEIIAYCWDKFLQGGDALWLTRLPMTKAAVRAMDTIQAEHPDLNGFVVSGASKRGWTTWTTAVVDRRVEAIIPLVIDVLNVTETMQHHYDAYGFWADSIHDYEDMGIMNWMGMPEFSALEAIVDPYSYVNRLVMPKYIVNATGDEFFLPDSSQFYFDGLRGEKYLRYVPNTDHDLNAAAWEDFTAFYWSVLNDVPRPEFTWTKEADGSIQVQTTDAPSQVLLWQATNPTARDFRVETIGTAWTSSIMTDQGGGVYVAQVPEPAQGWTAFLVELTYPSGASESFRFTTEVSVVPNVLPYAEE
jgi:PhoPQ-activated pathogenicity-related protein